MLAAGKTFEQKFDSSGTTEYYCQVHPWMTGKVTVQ
jgi:plastocyanin